MPQARNEAPVPLLERVATLALLVLLLASLFLRATTVLWSGALLPSIATLVAIPGPTHVPHGLPSPD